MSGNVLLVNMPFSGADRPQLALGILKAALRTQGISCDVAYLNLILAQRMGAQRYQWFCGELSDMTFAGEWVFARSFFGKMLLDVDGYFDYLRRVVGLKAEVIQYIMKLSEWIPEYLDPCVRLIDWERYSVIGFTSTFEQNMASLSLAYEIKKRYPDKIIVMGGSNCADPMGKALLRCFPFLDYIFSGESDHSFGKFMECINRPESIKDIHGLFYRDGNAVKSTGTADLVTDMDSLPIPDYDDYFAQLETTSIPSQIPLLLQFETARGCWWGAKHHCTFCGLNALSMNFRAKSQGRALEEIVKLTSRYPVKRLAAVDNIMDMKYFRELLPELKRRQLALSIFYEIKANLTKEEVALLREAGVDFIQPGIESFSPKLLKLMRKGVSPLQNIQLLKWCRQFGVEPMWNLLYGIPGESAEDYEKMLPLLVSLSHLRPPFSSGKVRLDRYSPYFQSPEEFGLVDARAAHVYNYIYPFSPAELDDLAYHYEFTFADGLDPERYIGPITRQLQLWREAAAGECGLFSHPAPNGKLLIDDSRPDTLQPRTALDHWQAELYVYCDQERSLDAIEKWFKRLFDKQPVEEVRQCLARLVELRLMAQDGDHYLSLAIPVIRA
jgi:ribosomal peptide maturation radical SAM protein 1